jgi:hypothetical protein
MIPQYYRIAVCKWCKVDVTDRGFKICATCLEKQQAARVANPEYRAKLVQRYHNTGSLYRPEERIEIP